MKNFREQGQQWALEDAVTPLYRYRRTWNQSRGDFRELDEIELMYEDWMSAFYDSVQMGLTTGKKLEDILDEIKAQISGDSQKRQEQIEAWAQGDEAQFETLNLDEIGKMLLEQKEGQEWD